MCSGDERFSLSPEIIEGGVSRPRLGVWVARGKDGVGKGELEKGDFEMDQMGSSGTAETE